MLAASNTEVGRVNICLFVPNWLGDLVMAIPALRAIRSHFGSEAAVVGILRPNLAGLLAGSSWLDEEWYFDPRGDETRFGTKPLIERLRSRRWDVGVLFTNSLRTALLALAGGVRHRVGYARYGRGPLLTQPLAPPRQNGKIARVPMVDYYLALAKAVGCTQLDKQLELPLSLWGDIGAQRTWLDLGLQHAFPVVAMHVGGAFGASKSWPPGHFVALARRIVQSSDASVLFVCGAKERETVRSITRQVAHPRVVSLADHPLDLQTLKSCLARCQVMVSTDSGPRHMAGALGKPVITLFGPTWPIVTANPTVKGLDLQLSLDCVPCGRRVCPQGHHRCMVDLTPDYVFEHLQQFLRSLDVRSAA